MKPVIWIATSRDDISDLPAPVKASFGYRLHQVQRGETPLDMRPLRQFGSGVCELRDSFERNAYRVIYVVNLGKAIYVLHAFMKKSKSGIGLSKQDVTLVATRLRRARALEVEGDV